MTSPLLSLASLLLVVTALISAALTAAPILLRRRDFVSPAWMAWAAPVLGVFCLAAAVADGSTRLLDLATVAGIVLVGGVAGAGWHPPGRRLLLVAGLLGFAAGVIARWSVSSGAVALMADPGWSAIRTLDTNGLAWGMARAAGFVAFLSATGAVLLGTRRPARLPVGGLPARVYALHRALGMAAVLALVTHLTALWLDSFVTFSWTQLLLTPWTSSYRPFAVTLGFLAMVALFLTAASGGLRRLLPGWRVVHALAYVTFVLGLVHGLLAGSDTGSPVALAFYLVALLVVGWTLFRRFYSPPRTPKVPSDSSEEASSHSTAPGRETRKADSLRS
ncbi:MAG: ferric reductase-like transmembrane domain-containing protein [Rubrobacteraceae bacterium]